MDDGSQTKFTIIAHSTGSLVAYKAMQYKNFPVNHLMNVFNLAGPLAEAPQQLSADVQALLDEVIEGYDPRRFSHVANFNFNGGPRDQLVPHHITSFSRFTERYASIADNFYSLGTLEMRNVFESIDHGS